jgi:hypothetical protein
MVKDSHHFDEGQDLSDVFRLPSPFFGDRHCLAALNNYQRYIQTNYIIYILYGILLFCTFAGGL